MAYRRRRRGLVRRRRRSYRRGMGRRRRTGRWLNRPRLNRLGTLQSDAIMVPLKTVTVATVTGTTTSAQTILANSCFDPFGTSGALQPAGFDQYATLYLRYEVYFAVLTLEVVNQGNTYCQMGLAPSVSGTGGSPIQLGDLPYGQHRIFGTGQITPDRRMVRRAMSTRKIYGAGFLDKDFSALTTADPTQQWFFYHSYVAPSNLEIVIKATLKQYVKFWQRRLVIDVPP